MRYLLILLLALHGLIHLMGFGKAFGWSNFQAILKPVSKTAGMFWLLTCLLLLAAALLLALRNGLWWLPALGGMVCSQALIAGQWQEARWGSLANLLVLAASLPAYTEWHFRRSFHTDTQLVYQQVHTATGEVIQANDLAALPHPVQRYLHYTGCVGKTKVQQMRVRFNGQMREKGKNFFSFSSEQYNNLQVPARLFFMRARVQGLPTTGYHRYVQGHASMNIKVLSAIPVAQSSGAELDQAETVTFFNDLCILAPAALIDPRIRWEAIDDISAKAFFTNGAITISALLLFNKRGELVNFISDDRYALSAGKLERYRFSTPVSNYKWYGGYRLASKGEAVWHYPDGPFTYGRFELQSVAYNESAVRP